MNDFEVNVNQKLGEGAYSIVYKARRLVDGNVYALKKVKLLNLSEKEKMNALNEVRILASLKSNYVISYKEAFFDENESCLGIVMEYADKGDLYQKITEFKKAGVYFDESDIWRIFIQLVKGLKALHDLKILHRDLKSANVFLFNDGSAKLGDLNVSKVARRGLGYTQTGTPYYASPEVWRDQPYDLKSDIWSLGCVLYEMITLKPPFRAENMEGLFNKVCKGQFSRIPDRFSSDLSEIVRTLLQVSPEGRPNCDQILKNPIVQKRLEHVKTNVCEELDSDNILLQTIRIPKNLLILTDKLPQANYDKARNKNKKKLEDLKKKNLTESSEMRVPKRIIVTDGNSSTIDDSIHKRENSPIKRVAVKDQQSHNQNQNHQYNNQNHLAIISEEKKGKVSEAVAASPIRHENKKDIILPILKNQGPKHDASPNRDSRLVSPTKNGVNSQKVHIVNNSNNLQLEIKNQQSNIASLGGNLGSIGKNYNDHLANIYKIYNSGQKYDKNKYNNEKANYIKKLEKYSDYHNVYKPKKYINEINIGKKLKLAPIQKRYI